MRIRRKRKRNWSCAEMKPGDPHGNHEKRNLFALLFLVESLCWAPLGWSSQHRTVSWSRFLKQECFVCASFSRWSLFVRQLYGQESQWPFLGPMLAAMVRISKETQLKRMTRFHPTVQMHRFHCRHDLAPIATAFVVVSPIAAVRAPNSGLLGCMTGAFRLNMFIGKSEE